MSRVTADESSAVDRLRDEVERLRRERDALAARVLELEQQCVASATPVPAAAPGFEDAFRIEQSRAKRHGQPLALALIELDGLQDLRDSLGHPAGEEALLHLERRLEASMRPTDVLVRVDGLAWGVLLTATGLEQGLAAMNRLQAAVAAEAFGAGPVRRPLGFSAGLVQWRTDEALGDLTSRASRALGQARRAGGGRTVLG